MAGSFEFSGPPSAVVDGNNSQYVPTPGDGNLATESSHTNSTKITVKLRAMALADRAETNFEDVPLFVVNGEHHTDEHFLKVHSLYYLNWQLRQAALAEFREMNNGIENPNQKDRKRRAPDYKTQANFKGEGEERMTVNSVAHAIRYIGYHVAGMGNSTERTQGVRLGRSRQMASQLQGSISHVPNIYMRQDADSSKLDEGDLVGFTIKRILWKMGSTNWEGHSTQEMDRQHPEEVIQVIPVAGVRGRIPMGYSNDLDTDGDTYDYKYVKLAGGRNEMMPIKITVPAIFIPVGRVIRVSPQEPSDDVKYHASFSYSAYEMTKTRRQTVDLDLGIRYPSLWGV